MSILSHIQPITAYHRFKMHTIHIQRSKTHARARTGDKTPNNALIELQPVRVLVNLFGSWFLVLG
jgi:hypothetical protein